MYRTALLGVFILVSTITASSQYLEFPFLGWKQSILRSEAPPNGWRFDAFTLEFEKDTLINNLSYSKLKSGGRIYFTRQEAGKLYSLSEIAGIITAEVVLYDFTLKVGDTFASETGFFLDYEVTLKEKRKIGQDSLWYMELEADQWTKFQWQEGVGDIRHGLFPMGGFEVSYKHICTLNEKNITLLENEELFNDCDCDHLYGEDNDNDGFRNKISRANEILIKESDLNSFRIGRIKGNYCDTIIMVDQSGSNVQIYNILGNILMKPDSVSEIDGAKFYFGFDDPYFYVLLTDEFKDVKFLDLSECYTLDCDDFDYEVNPEAIETCNSKDDNCDGNIDEGLTAIPYYLDMDNDGFGIASTTLLACNPPAGYVDNFMDCDDNNPNINPGQTEEPYNGIDDDCNPATLDDDLDQDGFLAANDCDDNNSNVNPSQTETPYNGIDDDCNSSTLDDDLDQDGFPVAVDCDDNNSDVNPDQLEEPYNDLDDDCDVTTLDDDLDQDGFLAFDDCDDNNSEVNPSQAELPYNGLDDDCNALTLDDDLDQDGYLVKDDCDDSNASINPDQIEEPYNGLDDDCDFTTLDDDIDSDGFLLADDCDDNNANINPAADDIPNNGIDEDCDGMDFISSTYELKNSIINIYPNPAMDKIIIDVTEKLNYHVTLYSLKGQKLKSSANPSYLKVESIPNGIHLLEVRDIETGQKIVEKLVIER